MCLARGSIKAPLSRCLWRFGAQNSSSSRLLQRSVKLTEVLWHSHIQDLLGVCSGSYISTLQLLHFLQFTHSDWCVRKHNSLDYQSVLGFPIGLKIKGGGNSAVSGFQTCYLHPPTAMQLREEAELEIRNRIPQDKSSSLFSPFPHFSWQAGMTSLLPLFYVFALTLLL